MDMMERLFVVVEEPLGLVRDTRSVDLPAPGLLEKVVLEGSAVVEDSMMSAAKPAQGTWT